MGLAEQIKPGDWRSVRSAIAKLNTKLGPKAKPAFAGLTLTAPLTVPSGGTGLATLTNHGLLLGSGTGAITPLAEATDGQIPIGDTDADPILATITGTANRVTVSNAAGSITLSGPQDIHTLATPIFARETLTDTCLIAGGANFLRVTGLQTDGTAMTGILRGAYIDVSNGNTAATGTIRGMELRTRTEAPGDTGNNVTVLEGLSISADSKGHSVTTMRVAEFILDGKTGGTITEAVGLRIANNLQVNKATTSYGLQIYRDSFDYTADIQLSSGGLIGGSTGALQITSGGNVGIGTANPETGLDIVAPANQQIRISTSEVDLTTKFGYFNIRHYDNSEEDLLGFFAGVDATNSFILLGGGSPSANAAKFVKFITATNTVTLTGTTRMVIGPSGYVGIGGVGGDPNSYRQDTLHLTGSDPLIIRFQNITGGVGDYAGMIFKISSDSSDAFFNAGIFFERTNEAFNAGGKLHFCMDDTSAGNTVVGDAKMTLLQGGNIGIGEVAPETLIELTSTAPYLTIHNSTHEDLDGGRESRLNFKGEQSGSEETTLARIEVSHDGAVDDQKGKILFSVNDGNDIDTPTQALEIGSDLLATFAGVVTTDENYQVDGTQVVSNQGAAVADATDAASTMARLNDLLARCRTHGLIAT